MKRSEFIELVKKRIDRIDDIGPCSYEDYTDPNVWEGTGADPDQAWEQDSDDRRLWEEREMLQELLEWFEEFRNKLEGQWEEA